LGVYRPTLPSGERDLLILTLTLTLTLEGSRGWPLVGFGATPQGLVFDLDFDLDFGV
jgi:hypothetical protein